jgi:hypothetical protein
MQGNESCTICGKGKYSTTVVASLDSTCTDCGACKYLISTGASAASNCTDCCAGTYIAVLGSADVELCQSCPGYSVSPSGSSLPTSCLCNPGYTEPDGGMCVSCEAGKYKIINVASTCLDCGAGTYSMTLAASAVCSCLSCPVNSHSPPGSTAESTCTCNVSYSGPGGGQCVALAQTTPLVLASTPTPSGARCTAPGLAQGVLPAIVLFWAGFERGS